MSSQLPGLFLFQIQFSMQARMALSVTSYSRFALSMSAAAAAILPAPQRLGDGIQCAAQLGKRQALTNAPEGMRRIGTPTARRPRPSPVPAHESWCRRKPAQQALYHCLIVKTAQDIVIVSAHLAVTFLNCHYFPFLQSPEKAIDTKKDCNSHPLAGKTIAAELPSACRK